MAFVPHNENPDSRNVGDCTIRAISCALRQEWEKTYVDLALQGFLMRDMPSANSVWGAYLRSRGFVRRILPDACPDCYTVADFAEEHPEGTYLLALSGHVLCVIDGDWIDTWDSGGEIPLYYWERTDY